MGSGASKTNSLSIEKLCEGLENGTYKKVIVMCGAGISTSAGIPDFRSPSTGLYFKLQKYKLPYPEAIFTYSQFKKNPEPFYHLVRDLFPSELVATPTHKFFTLLHNKNILQRIYTQNIDALEHIAGVPEEKIIEAHGTFHRCYCTKCNAAYSLKWLKEKVFETAEDEPNVPYCDKCGGVVRPDIVFFGESLPNRYFQNIKSDFQECDLLLVLGTSLTVMPFANLITESKSNVPRVYINLSKPGSAGLLGKIMGLGQNIDFSRDNDIIIQEKCDEVSSKIVKMSGWESDFAQIQNQTLKL